MSQPCYLNKDRRYLSIPYSHNLWCLPKGHKRQRLAHDHAIHRLMPLARCSIGGLWRRKNVAQRWQVWVMLSQPATLRMWMWIRCCTANWQVATVSPIFISPMPLSLKHAPIAGKARSEPVLALQRWQWLLRSDQALVLVLLVFFVQIYLSQALIITRFTKYLDSSVFISFTWFVLVLLYS